MPAPNFLTPVTLPDVLGLLRQHGGDARLLAGGTALVLLMQQKLVRPAALVSLAQVAGLHDLAVDSQGTLSVGAMVPLAAVAADARVRAGWPVLAQACRSVANPRLRNQATLGGNLAHADFASDPPAALLALDAVVHIAGPAGTRAVPLADFFLGLYATTLADDEVLTQIHVPALPARAMSTYIKYKSRSSEDRPCVGVAVVVSRRGEVIEAARVAVGAACEVPQRQPALEQQLVGQVPTTAVLAEFAAALAAALPEPMSDLRGSAAYRRAMTAVYVRRALGQATGTGERS